MRQVVLDTETTGLSVEDGHRIIEIGCLELLNRRVTGRNLHFYVNPERTIDEGAVQVHGITEEMLRDKPRFGEVADEVMAFVEGAEVIIHNAPFDVAFLDSELVRLGRPSFVRACASVCDTLRMARELHPGKRNSLDALCERYSVSNAHRKLHGALLDAELLADVYLAMTRGQDSLEISLQPSGGGRGEDGADLDWPPSGLAVVKADERELDCHAQALAAIEKEAGRPSLWARLSEIAAGEASIG
jgi:DNA polymerase III subunit epsilon